MLLRLAFFSKLFVLVGGDHHVCTYKFNVNIISKLEIAFNISMFYKNTAFSLAFNYSGDLNTGLFQYSNGEKLLDCGMFRYWTPEHVLYSNADISFVYHLNIELEFGCILNLNTGHKKVRHSDDSKFLVPIILIPTLYVFKINLFKFCFFCSTGIFWSPWIYQDKFVGLIERTLDNLYRSYISSKMLQAKSHFKRVPLWRQFPPNNDEGADRKGRQRCPDSRSF